VFEGGVGIDLFGWELDKGGLRRECCGDGRVNVEVVKKYICGW
jgi:hypothetical protein